MLDDVAEDSPADPDVPESADVVATELPVPDVHALSRSASPTISASRADRSGTVPPSDAPNPISAASVCELLVARA